MSKNVDTLKEMYAAFGRGDIPAIIDQLDANIEWDQEIASGGVPWLEPRKGANNIPAFFESLAPLEFPTFDPHTFLEGGDNQVMVLVHMEVDNKKTGKHYSFPYEGHLWWFNKAGKIVKYQHVTDTAQHWRVANGH